MSNFAPVAERAGFVIATPQGNSDKAYWNAVPHVELPDDLAFLGHVMDVDRRRLTAPSGAPVALTVAEFDLLHALVEHHGRVLSRDQLLEFTHRAAEDIFDRTIDVLILRLRRKIEPNPKAPQYIRTERGAGYVFGCDVRRLREPS